MLASTHFFFLFMCVRKSRVFDLNDDNERKKNALFFIHDILPFYVAICTCAYVDCVCICTYMYWAHFFFSFRLFGL